MNISDEIKRFILQKSDNGALLITGKWGCGKTYLLHKIMEDNNEKKENLFVFTSLFGIDNINNLHKAVKEAVAFAKGFSEKANTAKRLAGKFKKSTSPIMSALSESSKFAKGFNAVLNFNWSDFVTVEKMINCFVNGQQCKKQLVLIFDDFERSKIDKMDLMGAINEYSEGKGIKVIIVANEDEITDSIYNDMKEKLISRTVHMTLDSELIVNNIVTSYLETVKGYNAFLNKNISIIRKAFVDSQSENIRSLKSFLMDFERVYCAWKSTDIPMNENIEMLLYRFAAVEFECKAGNYINASISYIIYVEGDTEKFDKKKEIEEKYISNTFSGFLTSLSMWIVDGEWDEEYFIDEIKKKYKEDDVTPEQRFIYWKFWDLQQNDIDCGLPKVLNRAYNGEASRDELIALLQKVHAMKEYDISLPCKVDYEKMEAGLEERKEKIKKGLVDEPKRHTFSEKNQLDPEAIDLYNKIEYLDNQLYSWKNRDMLISYLNGDNNISLYDIKGKYIESFDEELLEIFIEKYKEVDNHKKRELCWAIDDLHLDDPNYSTGKDIKETQNNFKKLSDEINVTITPDSDKMANAISKSFTKLIDKKLSQFQDFAKNDER